MKVNVLLLVKFTGSIFLALILAFPVEAVPPKKDYGEGSSSGSSSNGAPALPAGVREVAVTHRQLLVLNTLDSLIREPKGMRGLTQML